MQASQRRKLKTLAELTGADLERLSTPELAKVAERGLRNRDLRQNDPLAAYIPHRIQRQVHASHIRNRLVRGSNRSGKTECGTAELGAQLLGFKPWIVRTAFEKAGIEYPGTRHIDPAQLPPALRVRKYDGTPLFPLPIDRPFVKALAVGHTASTVGQVIWLKCQKLLGPYIQATYDKKNGIPGCFTLFNGSLCQFQSYEQEYRKFEGKDWNFAWMDEACPQLIWTSIRRGLTDYGGSAMFTLTPDVDQGWMYDVFEVATDANTKVFCMSIWDNAISNGGYIEDNEIPQWISSVRGDEYAARVEGKWVHLSGRIYKAWDKARHVIPSPVVPEDAPIYCAIDPHGRVPWAIIWAYMTELGEMVIFREWPDFLHHEVSSFLESASEYAAAIRAKESDLPYIEDPERVFRVIDPRFAENTSLATGTTVSDELYAHGITVYNDLGKEFHRPGSVDQGHHKVTSWLETGQLLVSEECQNVIYAMDHYVWSEGTAKHAAMHGYREMPARKVKHFPDCIRMLVELEPSYEQYMPPRREGELEGVGAQGRDRYGATGYGV